MIKNPQKMHVFGIILFLFTLRCTKTEMFGKTFEQDLDRFIEKTMECRNIPGLTISVVKDSKTWSRGYGKADFSQGRLVDNTTQFLLASVTKSITMVLLGILLTEKGKMKYWPQQLPFRDAFIYSNIMFAMMGRVAEKLGGDTWENLVTNKVLHPIGMLSTRILKDPTDLLKNGVAKPYIFKDNVFQNGTLEIYSFHLFEPATAILSTGEDMAKYIRFNLKGGVTEFGKSLLDRELLLKAFTATTPTVDSDLTRPEFPVSDTTLGYGYAWLTATYRGFRKIWHHGGIFSYRSAVWIFPDINAGIYANVNGPSVLNLTGYALRTILYNVSDKLIAKGQWLNETTTCEFPQPWQDTKMNATPSEPFGKLQNPSEYVGYYGNNFLPGLNVSTKLGDCSSLLFQMNRLKGVLHSTHDKDRFLLEITSPWEYRLLSIDNNNVTIKLNTTFLRNEIGVVTSLEIQYLVKVVFTKGVSVLNDLVSGTTAGSRQDKYLSWG